jgi:hypothetical protein
LPCSAGPNDPVVQRAGTRNLPPKSQARAFIALGKKYGRDEIVARHRSRVTGHRNDGVRDDHLTDAQTLRSPTSLFISYAAAKTHVSRLLTKLGRCAPTAAVAPPTPACAGVALK